MQSDQETLLLQQTIFVAYLIRIQCKVFVALYVVRHTVCGHDAQGSESIASDQSVVVINKPAERLQGSMSQQRDLILIS